VSAFRRTTFTGIALALPLVEVARMFLALFVILLVMWLAGWLAFHVASGAIHVLLAIAVISLFMHFIRGPRSV
jgi:uncharacterized membrane protein YobD (UPF0266 family)